MAYFSIERIVCEVPSLKSAMRLVPCQDQRRVVANGDRRLGRHGIPEHLEVGGVARTGPAAVGSHVFLRDVARADERLEFLGADDRLRRPRITRAGGHGVRARHIRHGTGRRDGRRVVKILHFDIREQVEKDRAYRTARGRTQPAELRWKDLLNVVHGVDGQHDLLDVVGALRPPPRLAGGLDRRQQQRDQQADDRDHDQQFDQREATTLLR